MASSNCYPLSLLISTLVVLSTIYFQSFKMVKWRTVLRLPLALVTMSAFVSNFYLVSAIETSAVPPTVSSLTSASETQGFMPGNKRVPKQVGGPGGVVNGKDQQQQGTFGHGHGHGLEHGGLHHHGGDGKYFQYAHNPAYDEYEYGYRRGNDYHFQERYEKYGPHWNFKTKVKWGDKYGGYGEHYWDYNHAGASHGGGDDGGGHGHGDGHYSEPVPSYEAQSSDKKHQSMIAKRENQEKELQRKAVANESKRTTASAKAQDSQAASSRDARDYSRQDQNPRHEREYRQSQIPRPRPSSQEMVQQEQQQQQQQPSLVLDPKSGQIIDESTGKAYWLKPAN